MELGGYPIVDAEGCMTQARDQMEVQLYQEEMRWEPLSSPQSSHCTLSLPSLQVHPPGNSAAGAVATEPNGKEATLFQLVALDLDAPSLMSK